MFNCVIYFRARKGYQQTHLAISKCASKQTNISSLSIRSDEKNRRVRGKFHKCILFNHLLCVHIQLGAAWLHVRIKFTRSCMMKCCTLNHVAFAHPLNAQMRNQRRFFSVLFFRLLIHRLDDAYRAYIIKI